MSGSRHTSFAARDVPYSGHLGLVHCLVVLPIFIEETATLQPALKLGICLYFIISGKRLCFGCFGMTDYKARQADWRFPWLSEFW
jgi:hypothetical protein